jgi:hypothetical protein
MMMMTMLSMLSTTVANPDCSNSLGDEVSLIQAHTQVQNKKARFPKGRNEAVTPKPPGTGAVANDVKHIVKELGDPSISVGVGASSSASNDEKVQTMPRPLKKQSAVASLPAVAIWAWDPACTQVVATNPDAPVTFISEWCQNLNMAVVGGAVGKHCVVVVDVQTKGGQRPETTTFMFDQDQAKDKASGKAVWKDESDAMNAKFQCKQVGKEWATTVQGIRELIYTKWVGDQCPDNSAGLKDAKAAKGNAAEAVQQITQPGKRALGQGAPPKLTHKTCSPSGNTATIGAVARWVAGYAEARPSYHLFKSNCQCFSVGLFNYVSQKRHYAENYIRTARVKRQCSLTDEELNEGRRSLSRRLT